MPFYVGTKLVLVVLMRYYFFWTALGLACEIMMAMEIGLGISFRTQS
jgi:hypothetical protein